MSGGKEMLIKKCLEKPKQLSYLSPLLALCAEQGFHYVVLRKRQYAAVSVSKTNSLIFVAEESNQLLLTARLAEVFVDVPFEAPEAVIPDLLNITLKQFYNSSKSLFSLARPSLSRQIALTFETREHVKDRCSKIRSSPSEAKARNWL
jgi:hypothetical protein